MNDFHSIKEKRPFCRLTYGRYTGKKAIFRSQESRIEKEEN